MNVINRKQFQMTVKTKRGRPFVILRGDVNEMAAWKVLKQLETFQPSMYPINLDIGGVESIHWFATKILQTGLDHLLTTRGGIFLLQKGQKPKPVSDGDFSLIFSPGKGGHDEV